MLSIRLFLFPLMLVLWAAVGHSSPLQRRQQDEGQGSLQCNIDRLKVIVGLQESIDAVNLLSTQLANVSFVPNVLAAQNGIHGAQLATDAIGNAVFANQPFDHELNNQFANNVSLAAKALEGIVTTDSTANSTLVQALGLLSSTASAGNTELQDCGHT